MAGAFDSPDAALSLAGGVALVALGLVAVLAVRPLTRRTVVDDRASRIGRVYLGIEADDDEKAADTDAAGAVRQLFLRVLTAIAGVIGTLNLADAKEQEKLRGMLLQAGFRNADALRLFLSAKVLFMVLGALIALIAAWPGGMASTTIIRVVAVIGGALLGGMLTEIALSRMAKSRAERMERTLPDALDLLIICANAGYSLDLALARVARDIRRGAPEIADELQETVSELRMLSDRRQALENLATRTNLPSTRSLVSTMIQAQKYGTPLTQALRTLGAELRNERMVKMEERAARLPAMISMPLMALILPAIFLIVAGPAFIQMSRNWPG